MAPPLAAAAAREAATSPPSDGAYRPIAADAWADVAAFLGAPEALGANVMVRSEGVSETRGQAAWFLSEEARREVAAFSASKGVAVQHAGVKILEKRGGGAAGGMPARLAAEGVKALLDDLGDARRARLDRAAYDRLLAGGRVNLSLIHI